MQPVLSRVATCTLLTLFMVVAGLVDGAAQEVPVVRPGDIQKEPRIDRDAIGRPEVRRPGAMGAQFPVYKVRRAGVDQGAARALATALGIDPSALESRYGVVSYVDPEHDLAVPSRSIPRTRLAPDEDGDEARSVDRVIDVDAVGGLVPPEADEARRRFADALRSAGLDPAAGFPGDIRIGSGHAVLHIRDLRGGEVATGRLSTRIGVSPTLAGFPYVGPGAVVTASFARVGGRTAVTRLHHAWRQLAPAGNVTVLSPDRARQRCEGHLRSQMPPDSEIAVPRPPLVYYAPPLDDPEGRDVQVILPHFQCGGTLVLPSGERAELLREFVPATDDPRYNPAVGLDAQVEGNRVTARARVDGGRAPYTVTWHSTYGPRRTRTVVGPELRFDYTIGEGETRRGARPDAFLAVTVRDANGIRAIGTRNLGGPIPGYDARPGMRLPGTDIPISRPDDIGTTLDRNRPATEVSRGSFRLVSTIDGAPATATAHAVEAPAATAGVIDFGSEGATNYGWGKGVNNKFEATMRAAGVEQRFVWDGPWAWEQDFRAPADSRWADNADLVLYSGHGWSGGFTFANDAHDDGSISSAGDADADWGDRDLEWLALLSCNVLHTKFDGSGTDVVARWHQEFDGLHALLGFHTLAQLWANTPMYFAEGLTEPVPGTQLQLDVRQAWLRAIEREQPHREGVVMGPIRSDGVSTMWDHFHGRGSLGPDIRRGDFDRMWVVHETTWYHYDIDRFQPYSPHTLREEDLEARGRYARVP